MHLLLSRLGFEVTLQISFQWKESRENYISSKFMSFLSTRSIQTSKYEQYHQTTEEEETV
jgi:hypothetical protein